MARLRSPALPPCGPLSNHPVEVGQRTEAVILAELVKRGYSVLMPFGTNHRYDFVVDLGDRFVRVQCKTGRLRQGAVTFAPRSMRANTKRVYARPYHGEIDLFLVYCPDNERVYALPIDDVATTVGTLRVEPPANGQSKRIRWAADYELPA
jgi:hypothetical protein